MSDTLQAIQDMIASEVDQTDVKDSTTDDDWKLRRTYVNRAQKDFSEAYDWRSLIKEDNLKTSNGSGLASVALAADFRKLASYPKIVWDGTSEGDFAEIDLTKKSQYADSERYVYVTGNPNAGYALNVYASDLVSGASIYLTYYQTLPSLVSPADISSCPDTSFLVNRSLYYLYYARSDPRFQDSEIRASETLARLIEMEEARGEAHSNEVQLRPNTSHRWGK